MKKKAGTADPDDMPAEYDLDHSRATANRFASRLPRGHVIGVVLEEDVAKVFDSSEAVNRFLRSAIQAMPQRYSKPSKGQQEKKPKSRAAS